MNKGSVEERFCKIVCLPCGAKFYRETVYYGISCLTECPRCGSKKLKIVVKDITKLIEG
jgi:Zn finger protein HypA/HybF involved in hydrogenase expression